MPRKKKAEVVEVTAEKVLFEPDAFVIRTTNKNGASYGGFMWSQEIGAIVEAPDWSDEAECGQGLHGNLDGVGDWSLLSDQADALWWIIGVKRSECIDLDGKVKYPRGKVVYCGRQHGAMQLISKEWIRICKESPESVATENYKHASAAGDRGHASAAGDRGHASAAGDRGHASAAGSRGHASAAGDRGHASAAGDRGHASAAGDRGHASAAGDRGHASAAGSRGHASAAGSRGHASAAGDRGHASAAGDRGHASAAGDRGHASAAGSSGHASAAGDRGHASAAGDRGHASAAGENAIAVAMGYAGRARASASGALCVAHIDNEGKIVAIRASKVGENGIKPNTWYSLCSAGQFVEVEE